MSVIYVSFFFFFKNIFIFSIIYLYIYIFNIHMHTLCVNVFISDQEYLRVRSLFCVSSVKNRKSILYLLCDFRVCIVELFPFYCYNSCWCGFNSIY